MTCRKHKGLQGKNGSTGIPCRAQEATGKTITWCTEPVGLLVYEPTCVCRDAGEHIPDNWSANSCCEKDRPRSGLHSAGSSLQSSSTHPRSHAHAHKPVSHNEETLSFLIFHSAGHAQDSRAEIRLSIHTKWVAFLVLWRPLSLSQANYSSCRLSDALAKSPDICVRTHLGLARMYKYTAKEQGRS